MVLIKEPYCSKWSLGSPKSALTHQFSMRFADQAAYDAYNGHPAHVDFVATRWAHEVAEFQEYDFTDA